MKGQPPTDSGDISCEDVLTSVRGKSELIPQLIKTVESEKHRRVLELFFILGYSSKEISEIEERVSISNVTTIVGRFKEKLKT